MPSSRIDPESEDLKAYLLRNPVLMINEKPSTDDLAALELVKTITRARIVYRAQDSSRHMVLPRLVAGHGSYSGLDDIRGLANYIGRISKMGDSRSA